METITNLLNTGISYIRTIGVSDAIDILIVAYLIYKSIDIIRRNNSKNVARAILLLMIMLVLSYVFGLTMINYLLRKAMELGLIAIVVLFQPELRRLLERVGSSLSTNRSISTPAMENAIAQTVLACTDMSESHTGALIIFERDVDLGSIVNTGTLINADVTAELLTKLLRHAWNTPSIYKALSEALPIAGVDGTLKKRMINTAAEGNVRAKTGTVTGITSLAGYCTAPNGHQLCFAIINQGILSNGPGHAFQDRVCKVLCGDTEVVGAKEVRVAKKANTARKPQKAKPAKKSKKKKR